jgi:hypothetical protein
VKKEKKKEKKKNIILVRFIPGVSPPARNFSPFGALRRWVAGREAAGTRSAGREEET